jgi:ribonuclease Y
MGYLTLGLGAVAVGYLAFLLIYRALPKRLRSEHRSQRDDILNDAKQQVASRKQNELERFEEEWQLLAEQMEADLIERHEDLKIGEEDLQAQERSLQLEETRLQKITKEHEAHVAKLDALKASHLQKVSELEELRRELVRSLESTAKVDAVTLSKTMQVNIIDSKQIECQKVLKNLDDELSSSHKRLAQRCMSRVMSRYAPDFYWPKSVNTVELTEPGQADRLASDGATLIADLREKAQIEIELLASPEFPVPMVKLAGGAGVDREAVRLALTELLAKGSSGWSKAALVFDKHRAVLEQQAIKLGRTAIREVKLTGIHPEIQKLVGYLNWRTSYRQNQWYHTVEVAKLAGIIASEIGVDVDAAKRCGLLHDIGKAIDYRIEGSHAVISGDYADRFGEKRLICDTVMSHHNDLVIETPLAYVLRAADTLSGARPGARVNLEEGYQMRMSGIESCVRSFPGITSLAIMNGAREVHVEVNNKRVQEQDLQILSQNIARKIAEEVAFPGEIKILVSRRFEATAVA